MTTQPEALRLAGALLEPVVLDKHAMQAADELLRLHAECETLRQANVAFAARQAWWNDRMVALEAECEALRKSLALVQQHHATAWNRGHTMGMAANRQIAREAQEAVARDAWGNTQLTEALLAAEAECEALRVDALRWRVMREALIAIDFAWNSPPMSVAIFENHSNECFAGPECADAIADSALARNKEQSNG